MIDFTLSKYKQLLSAFKEVNYPIFTIENWIQTNTEYGILLRHDVDRFPKNAVEMAKCESELGVKATYYFRVKKGKFPESEIKEISNRGHEIGYHYEDLSITHGDIGKAILLFSQHLEELKKICDVKTIAMHGSPLSSYDNRKLLDHLDFSNLQILGSAYRSIKYDEIFYFTDTGRSWNSDANIRDHVRSEKLHSIYDTDELITFIKNNPGRKVAFTIHPERWNTGFVLWLRSYMYDTLANGAKKVIKGLRK